MKTITKGVLTTGMAVSLLATGAGSVSAATTAKQFGTNVINQEKAVQSKTLKDDAKYTTERTTNNNKVINSLNKSRVEQIKKNKEAATKIINYYNKKIDIEKSFSLKESDKTKKELHLEKIKTLKQQRDSEVRKLSDKNSYINDVTSLKVQLIQKDTQNKKEIQQTKKTMFDNFIKRLNTYLSKI